MLVQGQAVRHILVVTCVTRYTAFMHTNLTLPIEDSSPDYPLTCLLKVKMSLAYIYGVTCVPLDIINTRNSKFSRSFVYLLAFYLARILS